MTSSLATNLFEVLDEPTEEVTGFTLRDYQAADVDELMALRSRGVQAAICRWATGAGKSVLLADLAKKLQQFGRVMITVDASTLARDLVSTISKHTGRDVGVCTGEIKDNVGAPIIVSTVQTLYSRDHADRRRYERMFNPDDFAALLVDECETSIAEEYRGVVEYFKASRSCFIVGTTATPFRGDGQGMGEIYDFAADAAGKLNRDILWCRDNGWLVNVRQGFVHVNVDFNSLKVNRTAEGDRDYSDTELATVIGEEQNLIELARGIHHAAQGEPGIVICPNSTDLAEKLAWHMCSLTHGCAEAVHGKQGRRADELIEAFKRGDFPFLVSVNKLYKGFDADRVKHVFMARKTKSRRLYEQALGRGTRPLAEIRKLLNEAGTADLRRQIISDSPKPFMTMWDLAGCNERAKDLLGVIDILHGSASADVRQRAKTKMLEGDESKDTDDAAREAEKEVADEAKERERRERRKRQMIQVNADITTEVTDDLRVRGPAQRQAQGQGGDPATDKQIGLLRKFGINGSNMSKRQASAVISKELAKRQGPKQSKFLVVESY